MSDFNDRIIAEFRANGGHVETAGFGDGLVLLHSFGAKSAQERVHPLAAIPEDDDHWLVAASAAGAPKNPAWFANLVANPDTTIEVGTDVVPVTAQEVDDADYAEAWGKFTARSAGFAAYQEKAGRKIPVVRLTRR